MLLGRMRAAVLVGAGVTKVVQAMAEKASAVEAQPPRTKAAQPVQEEPAATAKGPEASAAKPEERQKSLFDF